VNSDRGEKNKKYDKWFIYTVFGLPFFFHLTMDMTSRRHMHSRCIHHSCARHWLAHTHTHTSHTSHHICCTATNAVQKNIKTPIVIHWNGTCTCKCRRLYFENDEKFSFISLCLVLVKNVGHPAVSWSQTNIVGWWQQVEIER
jgi:hypothetical protein